MLTDRITEIDQYVINLVKQKRNEQKLSQLALATLINKSDKFISNIENVNSRAKYNISHLNDIAKALGCSPKDFLPETPL